MKKINIAKLCNAISVLLLSGFVMHTIVDYNRYYNTDILTAAPFYLWVVVNTVYFIVPAVIVYAAGIFIRKKQKSNI